MMRIDNLPPELLLEIFEQLDLRSRLIASTVCHKWLHFLRKSTFQEDRQLFVNDNLLKNEPTCQFIQEKSRLKYHKVIISNVKNVKDHQKLWHHLGKSVHSAQIKSLALIKDKETDFLKDFSELRELKLFSNSNWKGFYQFDTVLPKLKKLQVHLDRYQGPLDGLRRLLETNDVTELEIASNSMNNKEALGIIYEYSAKLTSLVVNLSNADIRKNFRQKSFVKLKELSLVLPEAQNEAIVKPLLNFFSNVPSVELKIVGFIPCKPHKNLKSLEIENFFYDLSQLKALKGMKSLQKLTISYKPAATDESCFFHHERLDNPKLTVLKIFQRNSNPCVNCLENLSQSYPNLKDFETNLPLTNKHLAVLYENCSNLQHLKLEWTMNENLEPLSTSLNPGLRSLSLHSLAINEDWLLNWPEMPFLTSLNINLDEKCTESAFKNYLEKFPVLENISLSTATNGMVIAIVDVCKRLKSVATRCNKSSQVTEEGLKYVVKNSPTIRRIEFHCIKNVAIEQLKLLKTGENSITLYTGDSVQYL